MLCPTSWANVMAPQSLLVAPEDCWTVPGPTTATAMPHGSLPDSRRVIRCIRSAAYASRSAWTLSMWPSAAVTKRQKSSRRSPSSW